MRKIIALMLIATSLIIYIPILSVSASGCEIELSTSQNVDGYIDVSVCLKSNPGIASFLLKMHFDNTKLLPYSVMRGAILPGSATFSNNLSGTDASALTYVQTYFVNAPSFLDVTSDGVLYTIRFKIKDGVDGRVVFYLDNNCEMINQSETDVSYSPNVGLFTITESPVELIMTDADFSASNGIWSGNVKGLILENSDAAPAIQENNIIILAAYNSSNQLRYTRFETIKSLTDGQVVPLQYNSGIPFTISNIAISDNGTQPLKLKLYLWNSLSQMEQLAENDVRIITTP